MPEVDRNDIRRMVLSKTVKDDRFRVTAFLGNGHGVVVVPNRENYVYVQSPKFGVLQVFNTRVASTQDGLPVVIGYDETNPKLLQVLSVNNYTPGNGQGSGSPNYAPASRYEHYGEDPLELDFLQIHELRLQPTNTMIVNLYPGRFYDGSSQVFVESQNLDLSSDRPVTSGKARYVLVSLDKDGVAQLTAGTEVDLDALDLSTDLPAAPTDAMLVIGAVRVYKGQTKVEDTSVNQDIIDLRFPPMLPARSADYTRIILIRPGVNQFLYPFTATGLTDALADSLSGDQVQIPPGTLTGNFTLPSGVTLKGAARQASVIIGTITCGNDASFELLNINPTGTSAGDIVGVLAPAGVSITLISASIVATNNGAGNAICIKCAGNGSIANVRDNYLRAVVAGPGKDYGIWCESATSALAGVRYTFISATYPTNSPTQCTAFACQYLDTSDPAYLPDDDFGSSAAWDALGDPTRHTNDADTSATAIHHTLGTGAFQAAAGNHSHNLDDLLDVVAPSPGIGEALVWFGTAWWPSNLDWSHIDSIPNLAHLDVAQTFTKQQLFQPDSDVPSTIHYRYSSGTADISEWRKTDETIVTAIGRSGVYKNWTNGDKFTLFEDDVAEADAYIKLTNATGNAGVLVPYLHLRSNVTGSNYGNLFEGDVKNDDVTDTGPAVVFRASHGSAALVNRHAFRWQNYTTDLMTLTPTGRLLIGATAEITNGGRLQITGGADRIQAVLRGYSTQTQPLLEFQLSTGATAGYIDGLGGFLFQRTTDAVTAYQLCDKDGNPVLTVDTVNNRLGINQAAPGYALHVTDQIMLDGVNYPAYQLLSNLAGAQTWGLRADATGVAIRNMAIGNILRILNDAPGNSLVIDGSGRIGNGGTSFTAQTTLVNSADRTGLILKGYSTQTGNFLEIQKSDGTVYAAIGPLGGFKPASMADASASNNSIYYSTTASKLVYKDGAGVVNALY